MGGFFAQEFTGRPCAESDYVDSEWAPPDVAAIARYLRDAPVALATTGMVGPCGRCGAQIDSGAYHYDGAWLWPDTLAHLVERHGFVLPDRFVSYIRQRGYAPPSFDAFDRLFWPPGL